MATLLSSLPAGAAGGMGVAIVGEEPEPDDREPVKMRAAVFFDGTQNNRTNIETRLANAKADVVTINGQEIKMAGSFVSFYSNVAVMDYMNLIEDEQTEVSVYVEGIGTIDNEADDRNGLAFGIGPTGIPAKVTRGIMLLKKAVDDVLDEKKKLAELTVDVFGFSRGAAAARHFVARRTAEFFSQYTDLSTSLSIEPAAVIINFVGVYDTVSSYGGETFQSVGGQVITNIILDTFSNDVDELKLAMGGVPVRAVQLGAADEYRKNFARTTITSSVNAKKGFECVLPGVHSDIGGGYLAEMMESSVVDAYERQRLINEGWYQPDQLPPPSGFWFKLGTSTRSTGRRLVKHDYQFIPLSIMMQLAKKFGVTFQRFTNEFAAYAVPAKLQRLSGLMHKYVLERHDKALGEVADYELPDNYHWVRNEYLHRSAVKGWGDMDAITMGGREKDNLPDRQIISDQP